MEYTKSNPGSFYSMIDYLSKLTGLDKKIKKVEYVKNFDDLYYWTKSKPPYKSKKKLKHQAQFITVINTDGNEFPFYNTTINKRFDEICIKADHFVIRWEEYRPTNGYGIEIKYEGKYRDSLGGGWYSTISLYSINGNYFAPEMECSH